MKFRISSLIVLVVTYVMCAQTSTVAAEPSRVTVDASAAGKPVAPTMHGLFFEDINYAADGGLYAELVQNRSFEHGEALYAWSKAAGDGAEGNITVESDSPLNANNTHFLRVKVDKPGKKGYGAVNSGFGGIVLREGENYLVSLQARAHAGEPGGLRVELRDASGRVLVEKKIEGITAKWQKYDVVLNTPANTKDARLAVLVTGAGTADLDMISLFPEKTFKGRRNGLRADLAQALADMKPGFLRFPGGCIVEGKDFANAYRWKDTIGDISERKQNWNLWQDNRSPQYHQTYGLGFFEYFQFCEDIGAEPVPVINCGMTCQARQGIHVPLDELGSWVQDALDLIEFANGPATSTWGAHRAAMGHPEPFNLKLLGVGNEQWNQEYFDRYDVFYKAIKARYPEIQIISSSGPFVNDPLWQFAWNKFRTGTPADVVDEHYYVPPQWLLENENRYAEYDRKGPKIFVGEFASHDGNHGRRNTLLAGLTEAAYMTGLLKHPDVVIMSSYAPLFGKYGNSQWQPDLIWFDNSQVVFTPSYHAHAIFSQNRPDVSLPVKVDSPLLKSDVLAGMIGVGTWNTQAEYKDISVTAPDGRVLFKSDFSQGTDGWRTLGGQWDVQDGALRQNGDGQNIRAVAGDPSWKDYTLRLRARKLGGAEGFLIIFRTTNPDSPTWWNIGGWNNTEHSFQGGGLAERHVRGSVENNRWYDIRIELRGNSVKAFLDDKLIHEADSNPVPALYASAGRDKSSGELVLQVVNVSEKPQETEVSLGGVTKVVGPAKGVVLTSANQADENSLNDPAKVAPKAVSVPLDGPVFRHTYPANSLTMLRLKVE